MSGTPDHGPVAQVRYVLALHTKRTAPIDGYPADHGYCVEDRQSWPCATVQALEAARCQWCGGEGVVMEPQPQCGDYPHEHNEGCEVPVPGPCGCQPRAGRRAYRAVPSGDDGEPF